MRSGVRHKYPISAGEGSKMTRGYRFTVRLAEPEIRLIKRFADENHVLSSVAIRRLLSMGLDFQNLTRSKDVHQTKARTLPIG
jgi:hypothetical protein